MSGKLRKLRSPIIWLGVALVYALPFLALDGFGAAFMKFEGIKGESIDQVHKEEIDVLSWSWGASNSTGYQVGTGRTEGKVSFQDFTFTHEYDKTSPALALRCFSGKHIPEAIFSLTRIVNDDPVDILVITFSNVLVSSIAHGGSSTSDQLPVENVSIVYEKFQLEYSLYNKDGSKSGTSRAAWDLRSNTGG